MQESGLSWAALNTPGQALYSFNNRNHAFYAPVREVTSIKMLESSWISVYIAAAASDGRSNILSPTSESLEAESS